MQTPSIERSPIVLDNFLNRDAEDVGTSVAVFEAILASLTTFEATYSMGTDSQVSFTDNDFGRWLKHHKDAQQRPEHETRRGAGEVSMLMGLDGPHQIGLEVTDQDVLEIGPGAGLFARYTGKYAASLTLVDNTPEFLNTLLIPTDTNIIIDRVQAAELEEASFDKVFDVFAALTWGADMRSTAMAFYKELHLARVGGSLFAIPLFARLIQRAQTYENYALSGNDIPPEDAFKDFRDYTLGRSVIRVMSEGRVEPTFGVDIWDRAEDFYSVGSHNRYFDYVWGIFDKVGEVPNVPPDDLLRLGYDLQDGTKISSTISEEIGAKRSGFDLSQFSLPTLDATQSMR